MGPDHEALTAEHPDEDDRIYATVAAYTDTEADEED